MIPFAPGFFKPTLGGPTGTHLFYLENQALYDYFENATSAYTERMVESSNDPIFGSYCLYGTAVNSTVTQFMSWITPHSWATIKPAFTWEGFVKNSSGTHNLQNAGYVPSFFVYGGSLNRNQNWLAVALERHSGTASPALKYKIDTGGTTDLLFTDITYDPTDWANIELLHWAVSVEGSDVWFGLNGVVAHRTISDAVFPGWSTWTPYSNRYACGVYDTLYSTTGYQTWPLHDNVRVTHGVARYKNNYTIPGALYTD